MAYTDWFREVDHLMKALIHNFGSSDILSIVFVWTKINSILAKLNNFQLNNGNFK